LQQAKLHDLMRKLFKIIIPCFAIIFCCNCFNNSGVRDIEIEYRAQKIATCYDSTNIDIFRTWEYVNRGKSGIWTKYSGETRLYSGIYRDYGAYTELIIISPEYFLKDFGVNFSYEPAFWKINIKKQSSGFIRIIGVNQHGQDVLLVDNAQHDSVFKQPDPFLKFQHLTNLRDSMQFIGVRYYETLGGFIQFFLSPYHILTYIPSYDSLNPQFKHVWLKEFEKGNMIQKHWNLRKLDKPIDNG
jgi:hypothetical protein